jgi:peptidoglycan-associated lipoprotein
MKTKMLYTLALALAVVAATGCKHHPVAVTPIPPNPNPNVGDTGNLNTIPQAPPMIPPETPGTGIPPMAYNPDNFNQDANTLAPNSIHFAYDSAVVRDSEQGNLQAVAAALKANPSYQLLVQGNCDERGTEEYNRSLGERRALAAREALSGLGIDPSRVHEISFGKDKPADPGHDEEAWSKNRRDDFVLLIPKMGT